MPKIRVYQLAKELDIPSKDFVALLNQNNIPVKNHMSALTDDQVKSVRTAHDNKTLRSSAANPQPAAKAEPVKAKPAQEVQQSQSKPSHAPAHSQAAQSHDNAHKPAQSHTGGQRPAQNAQGQNRQTQGQNRTGDNRQGQNRTGDNRQGQNRQAQTRTGDNRQGQNRQGQGQNRTGDNRQGQNRQGQGQNRTGDNRQGQNRPGQGQNRNAQGRPGQGQNRPGGSQTHGHAGAKPAAGAPAGDNANRGVKKKKKTGVFKDKHAERPIKVRDNSKRTKSKRVDYKKQREEKRADQRKNRIYEIPEILTVGELAETLEVGATEIIKILMAGGTMATINQQIDSETAELVASELGYEVKPVTSEDVMDKIFEEYDSETTGHEVKRPPVVTVMGHVDHGKTSLLDRIRRTNVTAGEAGGITQHIGAYTVKIKGEKITFIDTPGHAAFTAMRSRGAQMTDIAVLVVAADDGVMPQTIEAINHSKAAGVPIIVAINKIDKEGANPDRVKQELTEYGLVVEEWGGDTIAVPVSAKKGENIEELLENILLVAEVEELKADPNRAARGSVIEAEVKKGKGPTASLLVQKGTLHVGDTLISGTTYGKIRTMIDDKGKRIKKAGPSMPVEISGLSDIPSAGDDFIVLENEKEARQLAEKRLETERFERQHKNAVSLGDLFTRIQDGQISDVNLIVKADVQGSVEALKQSLEQLNTDEVRVNVIHGAVGAINETDVMLASTSNAVILGFNVRPDKNAVSAAEKEEVDIHLYRVIYDAIEDVKKAMEGMLEPEFVEKITGNADVREVFRIPGGTMIAGSYVTDGKMTRNSDARVIRDGIVVFEGQLASLRRFKDDVKEVAQGYECGIGIDRFNDIKMGDTIETFVMEAVKREL